MRIWEVPSGKLVRRLRDAFPAIGQVAWRPDGKAVAAASVRPDDTIAIGEWDPHTGNLNRWIADGGFDSSALAYSAAGDRLAVGHGDGTLDLWDPDTATLVSHRTEHADTRGRRRRRTRSRCRWRSSPTCSPAPACRTT